MTRLAALLALACLGACQPEAPPEVIVPASEPVPAPFLAAEEIRGLLGSRPVVLRPAPADGAEVFYPDGRYVHEGRATSEGRYEVSDGRICVSLLQNPPRCRSIIKGENGEVRMGWRAKSIADSSAVTFEPLREN